MDVISECVYVTLATLTPILLASITTLVSEFVKFKRKSISDKKKAKRQVRRKQAESDMRSMNRIYQDLIFKQILGE